MTIRYITFDWTGHIYDIVKLLDQWGNPTPDPRNSVALVLFDGKAHIDALSADVPIYTVH